MTIINKIILFEYDRPLDLLNLISEESGIWQWTIISDNIIVTDDNSNTGTYEYNQGGYFQINSFRYDDQQYIKTTSLTELRETSNSFYYDLSISKLYVRRENFEPIFTNNLVVGVQVGFTYKENDNAYYNDQYYEPRVLRIFDLKKTIDPLFYGLLKYQSGDIELANNDGEFDDWRERNLFSMSSRIKVGNYGDTYDLFNQVYSGYIENDKRDWEKLSVTLQDPRKSLTQGVATNLLNQTDYPFLDDDNVDVSVPVAYGTIINAKAYCLNQNQSGVSLYEFIYVDTQFNSVDNLIDVKVNNVSKVVSSSDLSSGTFFLTSSALGGNFDDVTVDFKVLPENGISIIKDLLVNYNNSPYTSSFYDTSEIDASELVSRNSSIHIDESSIKLSNALQSVASDCDIRVFVKDNGLYTMRIYDEDRTPITTIYKDDWTSDPSFVNNGSQYLTSVRIGYKHNIENDTRLYYENKDYEESTFYIYKKYKTETFDTELTTLADAVDKSTTIMDISSNISDIIERSVNWSFNYIEPSDFIIANPADRVNSTIDNYGIYEIMNVSKKLEDFTIKLSMRFVKSYTIPTITINAFVDENDDYLIDENGNILIEEIIT